MKDALIRDVQLNITSFGNSNNRAISLGNNRAILFPTSTGNAAELCGDVFCQE